MNFGYQKLRTTYYTVKTCTITLDITYHPSVSFCRAKEHDAFGLIHPDEIIRMVHLIPRFKLLRTVEFLAGPTAARPKGEEDDWRGFSVNM